MLLDVHAFAIPVGTFTPTTLTVSMSVASARSTILEPNTLYRIWSSVDAFFQPGDNTVTATTSHIPITAKTDTLHATQEDNLYIAAIVSGGTGTLFITKLKG